MTTEIKSGVKYTDPRDISLVVQVYGRKVYNVVDPNTQKSIGIKLAEPGMDIDAMSNEQKKNVRNIIAFEQMDQGCQVWYEGEKYPMRHHATARTVQNIAVAKHIAYFLILSVKGNIFKKISGLTFIWYNKDKIVDWLYGTIKNDIYEEIRFYSPPAAELYRIIKDEKQRGVACGIVEFDTAYKFRFQDIITELNKELIAKNPLKEINRLAHIAFEREHTDDGLYHVAKVWKLIIIYLWLNRKLLKQIKDTLMELDIEKVKPHKYDLYYMYKFYPEYDFGGIKFEDRIKLAESL